ncbi:Rha family transcriptional regulator [Alcanivorax sp.]|uniref:Rha family transcriptional regulator n=1 Tax=Alcanivorax sp. TaxID=1872427 RepID=UPI0019BEC7AF|nr:Rha family transcriptional regulator [Alcanivorax sp.]MBD3643535.1 Rha family transcriptional regulator [Alcanivorax sp.]
MTNTTRKSAEVIQLRPAECIAIQRGRPVTTSFQVAQVFGKQHKHVTEKIRKLDAPDHFLTANFSAVQYEHRGNQYEAYEMTKDGFVFLVMGFTGKKAAEFKIAYIEAFNAMEKALHPDTLTAPQQRHIQQIVNKLAHQPGNSHAAVYRSLKDKFGVGKYDQIPANQYPAACRYLGAEPLEGEWLPAEESVVGETLNDTLARLTEQVKKPNSYPAEMFMPLVEAVLERRGGYSAPIPREQWQEVDERLARLGRLFHPFSDQAGDVVGIRRALNGLHPRTGIRERGFRRVACV